MLPRAVCALCVWVLSLAAMAQDVRGTRPAREIICDTADTQLGYGRCLCAQRDSAEAELRASYSAILTILNGKLAELRAGPSSDSTSIAVVEQGIRDVQRSQEAWYAFREANILDLATLGNYDRWRGVICDTDLDMIEQRLLELVDIRIAVKVAYR